MNKMQQRTIHAVHYTATAVLLQKSVFVLHSEHIPEFQSEPPSYLPQNYFWLTHYDHFREF